MTFKEGNIIAEHYELKRQLGQGSFGDVWLAHNLLADIDVAIKFYGTLDQKGIEEFRNEFKIAYKLHHPNLLNISHFDVFESCPYLVMPYCENGSLSQRIGQMPESEIWKFILDVSCGLAFLHNQKPAIVHQDIKPDNILITSDGRYVISDFGISRSFRTQMSSTRNKVNSSGTLAYMGPERFSEQPMVVLASDIWALGMTLYEAITGDVLWEGMGGCVQLNGARVPKITMTSPELSRLVSACLAAETWNRPTAQQLYDYAAAHIQHKQLPPLTYGSQEEPEPTPAPSSTPSIWPSVRPSVSSSIRPSVKPSYASSVKPSRQQQQSSGSGLNPFDNPIAKRILIGLATLVGVIILGFGIRSLFSYFSEEQDFVSCQTRQDFEQFIKDHPSSSYVTTARKRIEALTPAEEKTETTPKAAATAVPAQAIKEKVEIVTKSAAPEPQKQKADDRIYIQPSKNTNNTATTVPSGNSQNDDAIFYACQTIGDYQSYLNTFPQGRHRSQAQAAINNLLNRNDNTTNNAEPTSGSINMRNSAQQNLPPRRDRPYNSSVNVQPSNNRGSSYRSGGMQRRGSYRSGGSSHRHSN
jgi:serine/threonine protein kinase